MILVPIGHDQTIRRVPWVTLVVMVLCLLVQLHRSFFAPWPHEIDRAAERSAGADLELVRAIEQAKLAPQVDPVVELTPPPQPTPYVPGTAGMSDDRILEGVHEGTIGSDGDRLVSASREGWRELHAMLDRDLAHRMAYVPTTPFSVFMIVCVFAHVGWLHLAGNLIFLWLCGCNLEDRGGPWVFGGFYITCAWVSSLAYFFVHRGDGLPLVGASGAIAGAMGAFLVVWARARIKWLMVWRFTHGWTRTFYTPAFVAFPVWFVAQLVQVLLEKSVGGGVAYSAHVGGFVFGAAFAAAMRLSGAETKLETRREAKEGAWTEHPDFLRALDRVEKDPQEATRLLERVIADRPTHLEARIELCRLGVARRDASIVAASYCAALAALGRSERWADLLELADAVQSASLEPPLDDRAEKLLRVARAWRQKPYASVATTK